MDSVKEDIVEDEFCNDCCMYDENLVVCDECHLNVCTDCSDLYKVSCYSCRDKKRDIMNMVKKLLSQILDLLDLRQRTNLTEFNIIRQDILELLRV